ncbi:hypothetical protein D3C72_2236160 [compost metagenome]
MKVLLGMTISWLSKSSTVVARVRIRVTVPVCWLMVMMSPTRKGRSTSRMSPETKLAKISCRPKPRPTVSAAAIHCSWLQRSPSNVSALTVPAMVMA